MPKPRPKKSDAPAQDPVIPDPQETENLEARLAELKAVEADLKEKVKAQQPEAPKESTPLPEDRSASQATEEEVARAQILRDPFDSRNSLKILRDPPGKKLRWLSIKYREIRNMRGWTPVYFDDAIGRELGRYIGEVPPKRMDGNANIDNVVRRGDVFLAWIDEGIWHARQMRRTERASQRMAPHRSKLQKTFSEHASTFGDGLQGDENRYQEVRRAPGFVDPDEANYRARTRGDISDPALRTPGRNMFEEAPEEE
jgi:hypothetical protein